MTIETGPLGRTGAHVTVLGYGAMELRGQPWGPRIEDQEAGRLLGAVLDGGISLIDTSIDYGRSEELIGKYLGHRRDEYFLASKCGCLLGDPPAGATPPFPHDYSAGNVRAGVEQSLRRLCTDRLDLVQVHMSPSRAQLEAGGTVEALLALREEGKIRFTGMSGIRHCCIKRLRDHEAVNLPADVHSAAVTRARNGPDRVSGCHGAGADERFSCRMIMRSLNATVPGHLLDGRPEEGASLLRQAVAIYLRIVSPYAKRVEATLRDCGP